MSTAWRGSAVLLREPNSAVLSRLVYRLFIAAILAIAAIIAPWAAVSVVAWVFAGIMALLAVLAIANAIKNKRALLVHRGSGSLEVPLSLQELALKRPLAWVAGPEVTVTVAPMVSLPGRADPRVTLSDGTRAIERLPLYGTAPADFVAAANALLAGRGMALTLVAGEPDEPDAEVGS